MDNDLKSKLEAIHDRQLQALSECEALLTDYKSNDLVHQNEELQEKLTRQQTLAAEMTKRLQRIEQENTQLRTALNEQIVDERLSILKISQQKLVTYFRQAADQQEDGLTALQNRVNNQFDRLTQTMKAELAEDYEVYRQELQTLTAKMYEAIQRRREQLKEAYVHAVAETDNGLEHLTNQAVSPEMVQQRIHQNALEVKIGLNWLNKIGIFLVLLGVGAAVQYTYLMWFTPHMKGSFIYILGAAMLAAGEYFQRKHKTVFATGLIGGGLSVLYGGIFYSYFWLHIIDLQMGILFSVLLTLAAVVLSVRYHSQTVCSLALIGGYLPFFSYAQQFGMHTADLYVTLGYLLLLNLSVLAISFWCRWSSIHILSFVLHIPSLWYILAMVHAPQVGIPYTVITFLSYLVILLAYPLKHQMALRKFDVILLGCNTFFSCLLMYYLFNQAGLNNYKGLLAFGFCLMYGGLAEFSRRYLVKERGMTLLFYATALTFAALMAPFQLDWNWVSLGWLVEGSVLIVCGCLYRYAAMERGGWYILLLCLAVFYIFDMVLKAGMSGRSVHFLIKFAAVTGAQIGILGLYLRDSHIHGVARYGQRLRLVDWFKYGTIINLWLFLTYIANHALASFMPGYAYNGFGSIMIFSSFTLGLAFVLPRVKWMYDRVVGWICTTFYVIGLLTTVYVDAFVPVLTIVANGGQRYVMLAILLAFNLLVLAVVRHLIIQVVRRRYWNLEYYPLWVALYLFFTGTILLSAQFKVGAPDLWFSFVYLGLALGSVFYGFWRKYSYVRRFGLGLTIFALAKLFLFDLSYLSSLNRIIAYFCFGLVLLGISYLYQKICNAMEGSDSADKKNQIPM